MKEESFWRAISTIVIWVMLLAAFIVATIFLPETIGEDVIAVYLFLSIAGAVSTGAIWRGRSSRQERSGRRESRYEDREAAPEKIKNERIAAALRELSDDELYQLRDSIARGTIDEERLAALIDED